MPFVRSREDAEFVEQEMKLRRCFEVEYWGHETWFRIQPKNRDPQSLLCLAWFIEGMYHGMGRQPKGRDGMPLAKNFEDATFACRWAKRRFDDWKHIKPEVCCYYNDTTGMQSAVEDRGGTPDKGWAESIIAAFISGMYAERDAKRSLTPDELVKPNPPTDPRDGFTPGPWRVDDRLPVPVGDDSCLDVRNDSGWAVATAWGNSFGETTANASLIASAPTLLADNERQAKAIEAMREALRDARERLEVFDHGQDLMPAIDAALALAGQKGNEHGT